MVLVYTSERLNKMLGGQWQTFAGQPYFDKNGIFISAVLSAPLVLDMLVILVGLPNHVFCYCNTFCTVTTTGAVH